MVSQSCILDFRIFCLLLVTRAAVASVRSPKVCALGTKTVVHLLIFEFRIKVFFFHLLCAHVWDLCTFVDIWDKTFHQKYIHKSQSQSSTFHQNIYLQKSKSYFNLSPKKCVCKSQHQNSTYAGMAGVAEALFANAAIGARRVLKKNK